MALVIIVQGGLLLWCPVLMSLACDSLVVETSSGKIRGSAQRSIAGDEFCSFRGIPYAKSPIGDLRFEDPVAAEPWQDVLPAAKYAQKCYQYNPFLKRIEGGEDCLYLNVFTKAVRLTDALRAVMVWIHGGAFIYGSGDDELYGPDYFMRRNVVLVTVNYRLGIFGFLNLGDAFGPGNQGLKDQALALKWVRQNIDNFGGDPNRVTVFGESAGAASVHYLALSPASKGLFQRAIMQSGSVMNPWARQLRDPQKMVYRICTRLGMTNESLRDHSEIVRFLKSTEGKQIVKAQRFVSTNRERLLAQFPFGPSVDRGSKSPFMPNDPLAAANDGVDVPLIVGHTAREGIYFLAFSEFDRQYRSFNKGFERFLHPEVVDSMRQRYNISGEDLKYLCCGGEEITSESKGDLIDLLGDVYFVEGIHQLAKIQTQNARSPTYLYRYAYERGFSVVKTLARSLIQGAAHADDLTSLFRMRMAEKIQMKPFRKGSPQFKLMEKIIDFWVNFAESGDPNSRNKTSINWRPVGDPHVLNYVNLDSEVTVNASLNLEKKYIAFKNTLPGISLT